MSQSYKTPPHGFRILTQALGTQPDVGLTDPRGESMRPSLFLRVGAGLTLLFAVGHTLGAFESWSPPGDTPVLQSMKTFRFDASGVSRTYWDFYVGFGLYLSVLLFLQAVVLWQLATMAREEPARIRPVILMFLVASAIGTYVIWTFIFVVPALFSLACTLCLALGVLTSGRASLVSVRRGLEKQK